MNSLRIHDVHTNPQLNTQTHQYAKQIRPEKGRIIRTSELHPGLNEVIINGHVFGQTFDIDVEARSDDGVHPQAGIINFAAKLGIAQDKLVMPYLSDHTTNVKVISSPESLRYYPQEGRVTAYDYASESRSFDAVIITESDATQDYVLAITGADCPSVVGSGFLSNNTRFIFGIHAGRKGCLGGIIENTAEQLIEMGVEPGSVNLIIAPGGQTLELPLSVLDNDSQHNKHISTHDIWKESVVTSYSDIATKQRNVIYDNQADVIRRTLLAFGSLIENDESVAIIDANTLSEPGLKSYRGQTIAKNNNDVPTVQLKSGRNAIYTRF